MSKILFRQHRGTLEQSLETVIELEGTKQAIANYMSEKLRKDIDPKNLACCYYDHDDRINWPLYIIELKDFGILGWSNAQVY